MLATLPKGQVFALYDFDGVYTVLETYVKQGGTEIYYIVECVRGDWYPNENSEITTYEVLNHNFIMHTGIDYLGIRDLNDEFNIKEPLFSVGDKVKYSFITQDKISASLTKDTLREEKGVIDSIVYLGYAVKDLKPYYVLASKTNSDALLIPENHITSTK